MLTFLHESKQDIQFFIPVIISGSMLNIMVKFQFKKYRVSQIVRAATDGCRSRPWLSGRPASGSAY